MRIEWPFSFNSTTSTDIIVFITLPGSTTNLTSIKAIVDPSDSKAYLI